MSTTISHYPQHYANQYDTSPIHNDSIKQHNKLNDYVEEHKSDDETSGNHHSSTQISHALHSQIKQSPLSSNKYDPDPHHHLNSTTNSHNSYPVHDRDKEHHESDVIPTVISPANRNHVKFSTTNNELQPKVTVLAALYAWLMIVMGFYLIATYWC